MTTPPQNINPFDLATSLGDPWLVSTDFDKPLHKGGGKYIGFNHRRLVETDDPMVMEVAEVHGIAMRFLLFADWERGRYIVAFTFDGPMRAGAGATLVDAVYPFDPEHVADQIRAYMAATAYIHGDVAAQIIDNA